MVGETKRRKWFHATVASQMKTARRDADSETFFSSEGVLCATEIHFFMEERLLDKYPDA